MTHREWNEAEAERLRQFHSPDPAVVVLAEKCGFLPAGYEDRFEGCSRPPHAVGAHWGIHKR